MMAGLVAVGVLSDEARDVGIVVVAQVAWSIEQSIEMSVERILATHQFGQSVHVVWHQESILPRVALGVVTRLELRIEVLGKRAQIAL